MQNRRLSVLLASLLSVSLLGCKDSQPSANAQAAHSPTQSSNTQSSDSTGNFNLADRRVIEQYNSKFMPDFTKRIADNCKESKVAIEIDWNSFGSGPEASQNVEALTNSNAINQSVEGVVSALQNICSDDMGRKAVASKMKTVRVQHVKDQAAPSFKFADGIGTLLVDVKKSDSPWSQDIQKAIESGL
jgi:hypothetical protein